MIKELPSISYLHKVLQYDSLTGLFRWLKRTPDMFVGNASKTAEEKCAAWNLKHDDEFCFDGVDADGYNFGYIDGRRIRAAHLAWAWTYGVWPQKEGLRMTLDNGRRDDNSLSNLKPLARISRPDTDIIAIVDGKPWTYG